MLLESRRRRANWLTLCLICLLPWQVQSLWAAAAAEGGGGDLQAAEVTDGELDRSRIEARIADLEAEAKGDQDVSAELGLYRAAMGYLREAGLDYETAARLKQIIDTAAEKKTDLEAQIAELKARGAPEPWLVSVLSADELESRLDQARAEAKVMQNRSAALDSELAGVRVQPQSIGDQIAAGKQRLRDIWDEIRALEPQSTGAGIEAKRTLLRAELRALESRLNRREMERLSQGPRTALLRLQKELLKVRLARTSAHVEMLQVQLTTKRGDQANQLLDRAVQMEQQALGKHQVIAAAAKENAELGRSLQQLTEKLQAAVSRTSQATEEQQRIKQRLNRASKQLDIQRVDNSAANLLRSQRHGLPDGKLLVRELGETRSSIVQLQLDQLGYEDQLRTLLAGLADPENNPEMVVPDQEDGDRKGVQRLLGELLQDRLELLQIVLDTIGRYQRALDDLEIAQKLRFEDVEEYAALLDRNLLWLRSSQPLNWRMVVDAVPRYLSLLDLHRLSPILQEMKDGLGQSRVEVTLLGVLLLIVLAARPRMWKMLQAIAPQVGNVAVDRFSLTLKASVISLLLASPLVLLTLIFWIMMDSASTPISELADTLLTNLAAHLFLIQFSRYLFAPHGLGVAHFKWDPEINRKMRVYLRWLLVLFLVLATFAVLRYTEDDPNVQDRLGRVVAMVWISVLLFLTHRSLNPWSGVCVNRRPGEAVGWSWRLVFYLLLLTMLMTTLILSYQGYTHTASRLDLLEVYSFSVVLAMVVIYNLALRWLLITQRRLKLARARERREAVLEARAAKEVAEAAGESVQESLEIEETTIASIGEQTRRLLNVVTGVLVVVALLLIWSQVTPAVEKLDEFVLWEHTVDAGDTQELAFVTLWDLGVNLLIVLLMVVAGRNVPGMLEMVLLQPLKIDRGVRYAITQISQYLIYGIGTLFVLSILGVAWDDLQWLVAAMGVGLGFGLQEIFANFISGLIILFERPIRIGDTVSIGNTSGTVSRIRMRATTIVDWDNKELIIPNKSFVTDPLINWSLSDEVTRVTFKVGIAYGADTGLAHRIMLETLRRHPDVLEEPPPTVFFLGFGESSLDFEVRAFVDDRLKRLPLVHDLHMQLHQLLKEAGIEIPFPQRDVHIRSGDSNQGAE